MKRAGMSRRLIHCEAIPLAILFVLVGTMPLQADTRWTQWGGPNGDFTCDAEGLAVKWRDDGPAEVWSREIGAGHSTILHDDGIVYTMYRRGDKDAVLAVDANTGKTIFQSSGHSKRFELFVTKRVHKSNAWNVLGNVSVKRNN